MTHTVHPVPCRGTSTLFTLNSREHRCIMHGGGGGLGGSEGG